MAQLERRQIPQTGAFLELEHDLNDELVHQQQNSTTNAPVPNKSYASLAGSGSPGGGAKKDGTLPLDGIERYDHSGKQFAFQTNLNGSVNAFWPQPRPLPHLQLQPRNHRRCAACR